ncbi:MAG: WYL domain-containing protein [Bacteroidia bacterium]|nr:WYL domain-containing protein [Bacteroidia bacterium]
MAEKSRVFQRYQWLIDLIQRSGGITFEEIARAWARSSINAMPGEPLPLRTFHRHKNDIEEVFGITIKCHKSTNKYFIENEDEVESGGVQDWMLSTIAVDNMLNESRDLRDRIQFENIPGGREHLATIIQAMREGRALAMTYRSFRSESASEAVLKPYFLKVFEQRWYVIGPTDAHPKEPHTYALDRIRSLELTDTKFELPKKFSPAEYFSNTYGIFHSDEKPEIIRLKVKRFLSLYLDSLPLHRTQKRIDEESTDEYVIYQLYMTPTIDLVNFLCSRGSAIEVLESASLRAQVAEEVARMYSQYCYKLSPKS